MSTVVVTVSHPGKTTAVPLNVVTCRVQPDTSQFTDGVQACANFLFESITGYQIDCTGATKLVPSSNLVEPEMEFDDFTIDEYLDLKPLIIEHLKAKSNGVLKNKSYALIGLRNQSRVSAVAIPNRKHYSSQIAYELALAVHRRNVIETELLYGAFVFTDLSFVNGYLSTTQSFDLLRHYHNCNRLIIDLIDQDGVSYQVNPLPKPKLKMTKWPTLKLFHDFSFSYRVPASDLDQFTMAEKCRILSYRTLTSPALGPIASLIRIRVSQLDWDRISQMSMLDPVHQEIMTYLLKTVSLIPHYNYEGLNRKIVRNRRSTDGEIIALDWNHIPLIVVKTHRISQSYSGLAQEAMIGLVLNNLRKQIPTFVQTYAMTECFPPALGSNTVVGWCSRGPATARPKPGAKNLYLLLEAISGSTVQSFLINHPTRYDILDSILLQVVNAINLAYEMYDFTHYDLHTNNVIIQELSSEYPVAIYQKGVIVGFHRTKYLARIIDFGLSHLKYQDLDYGTYTVKSAPIKGDQAYPITDPYKFIVDLLLGIEALNRQSKTTRVWELGHKIYHFIDPQRDLTARLATDFSATTVYGHSQDFQLAPWGLTTTIDQVLTEVLKAVPMSGAISHGSLASPGRDDQRGYYFSTIMPSSLSDYYHVRKNADTTEYQTVVDRQLNNIDLNNLFITDQERINQLIKSTAAKLKSSSSQISAIAITADQLAQVGRDLILLREDCKVVECFVYAADGLELDTTITIAPLRRIYSITVSLFASGIQSYPKNDYLQRLGEMLMV